MEAKQGLFAIYSRKSRFTGKGESIENQIELCRAYILRVYGEEVQDRITVYEDEGYSGKNTARPAFRAMMEDARRRKLKSVVVYRLDRISRNIGDFSGLIEELSRLDMEFISIREQFDTGSPMGRAMMYISSVFSQLERETIAERIRDNMHELAKTGRWLGGTTPTGYTSESVQRVTLDGRVRKACRLVPVAEEQACVRQIFELFLEKESLTQVEAELLGMHRKTKTGKSFSRFAIRAILRNPVYVRADQSVYAYFTEKGAEICAERGAFDGLHGILAYNRTDQEKGRATRFLPEREWVISVGAHEGVIAGEDWIRTQACLDRNKDRAYRRPGSNRALLTGLLFCACGHRMYARLTDRQVPEGGAGYCYVCSMKRRSKRSICDRRNAGGSDLDAAVLEKLKGLGETKAYLTALLEDGRKRLAAEPVPDGERIAELNRALAGNQTKIAALLDSLTETAERAVRKEITGRMEKLTEENEAIEARLQAYRKESGKGRLADGAFERLSDRLCSFGAALEESETGRKRAAVRALVRKIAWDGETAHVCLLGAEGEETPREAADREPEPLAEEHRDARSDRCESIANEILMHFRSRKKTAGDVSLSDALDTDGEGNGLFLMDVVAMEDDLAERLGDRELCRSLRESIDRCLSEREARIVRMRYGLTDGKPLTQLETARQCGISRSYVSRLEKRALEKLRVALEGGTDAPEKAEKQGEKAPKP